MSIFNLEIKQKKAFAKEHAKEIGTSKEVLNEVLYQIDILEQLCRGLNGMQILDLLQCENEMQVESACRVIKIA